MRTLARELFLHGRIQTTEAKAKEVQPFAERLITEAKKGTLAGTRRIESQIGEDARRMLETDIVKRLQDRTGGYTRVVKLPYRQSDSASLAVIELVA